MRKPQQTNNGTKNERSRWLLALAPVAMLLAAGFGSAPVTATDGSDVENPCFMVGNDRYCIVVEGRAEPGPKLQFVNGTDPVAALNVDRYLVDLDLSNSPVHPVASGPLFVASGYVSGTTLPPPPATLFDITVLGVRTWATTDYQVSLCPDKPCLEPAKPGDGHVGQLWFGWIIVTQNGDVILRAPVATVELYPLPAQTNDLDLEGFLFA